MNVQRAISADGTIVEVAADRSDVWVGYEQRVRSLDRDFYLKLYRHGPTLSDVELRLCTLLRLHFSLQEAAGVLDRSVGTARRCERSIRKKLGLASDVHLTVALHGL